MCSKTGDGFVRRDRIALPDDFAVFFVGQDAMGTSRGRLAVYLWKEGLMFLDDFGVLGVLSEIFPLVGILAHVVEFLGTIGVLDEAPVLGSDAVVVVIVGSDGGPLARG